MTLLPLDLSVSDGRRRTAVAAANWLAALLAEGPVESREILAKGAEAGLSPKALRHARESLQLRVVRTGVRQTMETTWSLPTETDPGTNSDASDPSRSARAREADAHHGPRARARAYMSAVHVSPTTGKASDAQFSDGERLRIERRVVYFRAKGIPQDEAAELARHLVLERDRVNERRFDGSCAECEAFAGGSCQAEEEGAGVAPRPIQEVWNCWCARRPMP